MSQRRKNQVAQIKAVHECHNHSMGHHGHASCSTPYNTKPTNTRPSQFLKISSRKNVNSTSLKFNTTIVWLNIEWIFSRTVIWAIWIWRCIKVSKSIKFCSGHIHDIFQQYKKNWEFSIAMWATRFCGPTDIPKEFFIALAIGLLFKSNTVALDHLPRNN